MKWFNYLQASVILLFLAYLIGIYATINGNLLLLWSAPLLGLIAAILAKIALMKKEKGEKK